MRTSLKTILSVAILSAAVSAPALAASSDGFKIPVPTPKPVETFEVAQAENGNAGNSTTATDQMQMEEGETTPGAATDLMDTGAIDGDMVGVSDFAVVDATKVSVKRVAELREKRERDRFAKLDEANQAEVQKLQADIMANPDLVAALEAQNVQINNIVFAQQNADGTVTFIVL
jgi:hypothetical protein